MTQQAVIGRDRTTVLIMNFQQRIVTNEASEPVAVIRNSARVLEGARGA